MKINEILNLNENVGNAVVLYGGRFQPMHQGHRDVYKHLVAKFGADNVFIATTFSKKAQAAHAKGDYMSDPFTFEEKKDIMVKMFGIPEDKIQKLNPYASDASDVGKSTQQFATVLVYGAKDMGRLGTSGDISEYPKDDNIEPGKKYAYVAPLMQGGMSASDFRATMAGDASPQEKQKAFKQFFGKFDQSVFEFIQGRLT